MGTSVVTRRRMFSAGLGMAVATGLLLLSLASNWIVWAEAGAPAEARVILACALLNGVLCALAVVLGLVFIRGRRLERRVADLADLVASVRPDTLLIVTQDRSISMCNESVRRMFGYTPEEVINRKTDQLYFDRRSSAGQSHEIYEALERDGFHVGVARGRRKDGSTLPLEIISSELKGGGGAVLLLRDISERVKAEADRRDMEDRLRQQQKLESLGVLAGGIAHDFNNLLMVILGNVDLALLEANEASPVARHIGDIRLAARRASELCREMLAYSGKGKFKIETLNLSDVVQEMGHFLEVTISKKARMVYALAEDACPVDGDAAQIRQIVSNLITNASDAIGDNAGTITIRTGARDCDDACLARNCIVPKPPAGRYAFLEVEDTGCGMDEMTRSRMFEPFFSTKFTGRGLGLASVQGIIRGHRGALVVDTAVGRGTTMTVLMPCSEKRVARAAAEEAIEPWEGGGTILVVEDEEMVRDLVRQMLGRLGFTVLTASDGREGVAVFREHADEVACVLLDMTMPRMGGAEAFREIRRIRSDARIILSSGYDQEDAAALLGGDDRAAFVRKPYEMSKMTAVLRRMLGLGAAA